MIGQGGRHQVGFRGHEIHVHDVDHWQGNCGRAEDLQSIAGRERRVEIEPAPGQSDPEVHARPRADYAETVKQTSQYLGDHSYKDDIRELLAEVDRSENVMKGPKLRVVEKENFIDSLVQRKTCCKVTSIRTRQL